MSSKNKLVILINVIDIFVLIPLILFISGIIRGKSYYLFSVIIILLLIIPFFLSFESRKPNSREIVTVSVMTALAVCSRAAFAFVPHFKPMIGIIIITGALLGSEAGFLTGAMCAFISNFLFGQGYWTLWQIFSYGIAGFLTGILIKYKFLPRKPFFIALYGFVLVILIVGPILDTSSLFMMISDINIENAAAIYLSGLPVNIIHGIATFLTLFLLYKPFEMKIERMKQKYGLMEGSCGV